MGKVQKQSRAQYGQNPLDRFMILNRDFRCVLKIVKSVVMSVHLHGTSGRIFMKFNI